jgi:hypothetical protein
MGQQFLPGVNPIRQSIQIGEGKSGAKMSPMARQENQDRLSMPISVFLLIYVLTKGHMDRQEWRTMGNSID